MHFRLYERSRILSFRIRLQPVRNPVSLERSKRCPLPARSRFLLLVGMTNFKRLIEGVSDWMV
jgi:hypothetical protein